MYLHIHCIYTGYIFPYSLHHQQEQSTKSQVPSLLAISTPCCSPVVSEKAKQKLRTFITKL